LLYKNIFFINDKKIQKRGRRLSMVGAPPEAAASIKRRKSSRR
jgi:hypothetical protein